MLAAKYVFLITGRFSFTASLADVPRNATVFYPLLFRLALLRLFFFDKFFQIKNDTDFPRAITDFVRREKWVFLCRCCVYAFLFASSFSYLIPHPKCIQKRNFILRIGSSLINFYCFGIRKLCMVNRFELKSFHVHVRSYVFGALTGACVRASDSMCGRVRVCGAAESERQRARGRGRSKRDRYAQL